MKITKLLFALITGTILVSCNCHKPENEELVPYRVTASFAHGYPGATNIEWEVEGDLFEAEFNYHFTKYEVKYDVLGRVVEIEYVVDNKSLPEGVLAQVEAKYPNRKFQAEYVEHRRFGYWEVASTEDAEGEEEVEMTFTIDGKLFEADAAIACIDKCYANESCAPKGHCDASNKCEGKNKADCHGEAKCKDKSECHGEAKCEDKSTSCQSNGDAHHQDEENEDGEAGHEEGDDRDEEEHH